MEFTLRIMGSASAKPMIDKNPSAQALSVHGRLFLIDCGEGTQTQCLKYGVSLLKIDSLFISHIHGDHCFGFFGLLSTMGLLGRRTPLNIYAPSGFGPVLRFFLSYYGDGLQFEVRFNPMKMRSPETVYETKSMEILAFPLNHGIETYGYMFREKMPQRNVDKDAILKYGFTLAEIASLKRGEDVLRPAGRSDEATFMNGFTKCSGTDEVLLIPAAEVSYIPYAPRSYAYCSDTAPFPELSSWLKGVTLLYHETTYLSGLEDDAAKRRHSTTLQAAACALDAAASKLIIGHYSARCKDIKSYEAECRTLFPETTAVSDGDVFEL